MLPILIERTEDLGTRSSITDRSWVTEICSKHSDDNNINLYEVESSYFVEAGIEFRNSRISVATGNSVRENYFLMKHSFSCYSVATGKRCTKDWILKLCDSNFVYQNLAWSFLCISLFIVNQVSGAVQYNFLFPSIQISPLSSSTSSKKKVRKREEALNTHLNFLEQQEESMLPQDKVSV